MVDESCPVCRTADIVCGKWTLLLVRELSEGQSRFCELERSLDGISPRTLSLRLRALEVEGIVERRTFAEVPPRVEYRLSPLGTTLVAPLEGLSKWAAEHAAAVAGHRAQAAASVAGPISEPAVSGVVVVGEKPKVA